MRDFVALQEFVPQEKEHDGRCIWCAARGPKNRAHIISRRLTNAATNGVVLRFSVCRDCNSKCGKIEEWVLRRTPLSWVRLMVNLAANADSDTRAVPSYFYTDTLRQWVVFDLDAKHTRYAVPTQLLLGANVEPCLISESPPIKHDKEMRAIQDAVGCSSFRTDVRPTLPADFAPRFLLQGDSVTLVVRSPDQAGTAKEEVRGIMDVPNSRRRVQLKHKGEERWHFQWSRPNWARFCAKTAYEALCLFEGADRCLDPAYETVRTFVLGGVSGAGKEMVFDQHGLLPNSSVPLPVQIDLTRGQYAPRCAQLVQLRPEPCMHSVLLYELSGWVVASVSFSGFEPSTLILAGPDAHLDDMYILVYDDREQEYSCSKLAYDRTRPVIPLSVPSAVLRALASTYRLGALD